MPAFVPVMVTVYVPAWPKQERVEVPELPRVMLVGDSVHVRPEDGVIVVERETVPVNPFSAVTVTVEFPFDSARIVRLVGLAVTVKPLTVMETTIEWERLPLVPVTATWNIPADGKLHERRATPEPVRLVGVTVQLVLLVAKLTAPLNPLIGVRVMLDVAVDPAFTETLVGFAVRLKSWNLRVVVVEWLRLPLTPVIVRV